MGRHVVHSDQISGEQVPKCFPPMHDDADEVSEGNPVKIEKLFVEKGKNVAFYTGE